MKIGTYSFKGETPRLTDNLLEANDANLAYNCDMARGDLRAWNGSSEEEVLIDASVLSLNEYDSDFLTDTVDLDYVRSPIASDPYVRLYYSGKAEPRVHDITDVPPAYYKLGVNFPTYTPIATNSVAGTGTDEQRSYFYAWLTSRVEEGSSSPITAVQTAKPTGATWLITRIEAPEITRGITKLNLYRTMSGSEDVTEYVFVKVVTLPTIETFTSAVTTAMNNHYYKWTDGGNTLLYKCINDNTTCDPDDATNGIGGSGTDYWEWYTVTDDIDTASLDSGEVFSSETYLPPPAGLTGLIAVQNGMFAGFIDNKVVFSEPWLPHAWPDEDMSFPYTVVALAKLGEMTVVLTDAKHFLVIGNAPEEMMSIDMDDFQPCVSKRSVTVSKRGVPFSSNEGLMLLNQNGIANVTGPFVSIIDWAEIVPAGINGHIFNDKYFGFNPSAGTAFIFDFQTNDFTRLNADIAYAGYVSYSDSQFYIVVYERENPNDLSSDYVYKIKKWAGEQYNYKRYVWDSKIYNLGGHVNLGVFRIFLDDNFYSTVVGGSGISAELQALNAAMIADLSLGGAIGDDAIGEIPIGGTKLYTQSGLSISDTVTLRIYIDGSTTPVFTKDITESGIGKLPAGYKYRKFQYELSGYIPTFSIEFATTPGELNEAA